jgi:hypothetical protein
MQCVHASIFSDYIRSLGSTLGSKCHVDVTPAKLLLFCKIRRLYLERLSIYDGWHT